MAKTTAAGFLVDSLTASGVDHLYGITGDSLNAFADTIRRREQFRWVHTRHEEAAAFAAASEAHLTGRLAVCAGSCGPGNLHLINGLFDAHRSRVPVLAIASQIPSSELGTEYFQETHPERIFRDCAAFVEVVSAAENLPRLLDRAVRTAIGERDVGILVIPGDVAWAPLEAPLVAVGPDAVGPPGAPSASALERLAGLVNAARAITIFAGAGAAGAQTELLAVAQALQAPIVHTLRGKEFVEPENPFDVGMTGLLGFASGYQALAAADLVLLLGTSFPYRQFYPEKATIVQIDRRADEIGRRSHVELGIVADVRATLAALLPRLTPHADGAHLAKALTTYRSARAALDARAADRAGARTIHPQRVAALLDRLAAPDAVFTVDVGTPTVWAARYLRFNGRRRLVGSFNHGSMANALPHAIGAQVSHPGRQVVALCGDGGISMLLGELITLRTEGLPVKAVVFNNSSLGFVELEMVADGILPAATDLGPTNFAEIAKGAGLRGIRVEQPAELEPALASALADPRPVLVDVVVQRLEVVRPPKLTWTEVSGFSLFLARAILGGEEGEVEELAHGSLLR